MTCNTVVLALWVSPDLMKDPAFNEDLLKIGTICVGEVASRHDIDVGKGDRNVIIVGKDSSHVNMRLYVSHGLVTIDIYYMHETKNGTDKDMSFITVNLTNKIKEYLGKKCVRFESMQTPIRRGDTVWRYFSTSDERLWEANYDELVFEKDSKWQNIRIYHSPEYGNTLHLDLDVMFAEGDTIYSETLLGVGSERRMDYTDKEVLILGGGDGGLIHLLRQENCKMVTMCEIDEEVINACRTHLPKACFDSMDEYEGPNHKIIIGDCVELLIDDVATGKKYDVVVNDLTEFPVDINERVCVYDFKTAALIMEMSLKLLKPGGRYLARGNCWGAKDYHERFITDVEKLGCKWIRRYRRVPSFAEDYAHYEVWIPEMEENHTS
ncbi:spermine synthase-like isoform X2 [Lineus longissimus]|uniref:spermine synthase-like isoform X2 n=1 Tax=Lineus longissimus TaxID=88925 RepID=UPI00315C88E9